MTIFPRYYYFPLRLVLVHSIYLKAPTHQSTENLTKFYRISLISGIQTSKILRGDKKIHVFGYMLVYYQQTRYP